MIFNKIKTTLAPLNIPVARNVYRGAEETYITVNQYLTNSELVADDRREVDAHYVQVSLFDKGNYLATASEILRLLESEDFIRIDEKDLFE